MKDNFGIRNIAQLTPEERTVFLIEEQADDDGVCDEVREAGIKAGLDALAKFRCEGQAFLSALSAMMNYSSGVRV